MQITEAAIFYSRLCKWEQYFDDLPVHTIEKQLYFRLAFEPATLDGYPGHFTEDISSTLEKKLESVKCYVSQFPESKGYVFDRVRAAAEGCETLALRRSFLGSCHCRSKPEHQQRQDRQA